MAVFDFTERPSGFAKWMLHAPTYVYRARLGFVFGHRFVMIEHRGRTSGRRYRTVVEVAGHNPDDHEFVCTSGRGVRSDWYRNLRAGGLDAVWVGSRRHGDATVRFLEPTEAATYMRTYEDAHPKTAAKLYDVMGVSYDGTDGDLVRMMADIPMVAFQIARTDRKIAP